MLMEATKLEERTKDELERIRAVRRDAQALVWRELKDRMPMLVPSIVLEVAAELAVRNKVWRKAFLEMANLAFTKAEKRRRRA